MTDTIYLDYNGNKYLVATYPPGADLRKYGFDMGVLKFSNQNDEIPIYVDTDKFIIYMYEKRYFNFYNKLRNEKVKKDIKVGKILEQNMKQINTKQKSTKTVDKKSKKRRKRSKGGMNAYGVPLRETRHSNICPICGSRNGIFADKGMCFQCYKIEMSSKFD